MMYACRYILLVIAMVTIVGCVGNNSSVPVYNRSIGVQSDANFHTVFRGETLYSIAWRYNVNYKKLAAANGIGSKYTIYPGQKLRVKNFKKQSGNTAKVSSGNVKKPPIKTPKIAAAPKTEIKKKSTVYTAPRNERWQWPLKGAITKYYSSSHAQHKGVDIAAQLGDSVKASKSGEIVYAGGNLRGYGNLIIVKHDAVYLSAYGYNSRLLVKEGDRVKIGQVIAEAGASAGGEVRLHFEIRKNGKPLNPLKVLPKK